MLAALSLAFVLFGCAPEPAQDPRANMTPLTPESVLQADEGPLEALIETSEGPFVIRLLSKEAPRHVTHFVKTARKGGYDGTTFHRVVAGKLLEGGDPRAKDPLEAEASARALTRGAVAAGGQFLIALTDRPAGADGRTVFGEVLGGFVVLDKIARVPVVGEKPQKPVVIQKITIRKAGIERTQAPKP